MRREDNHSWGTLAAEAYGVDEMAGGGFPIPIDAVFPQTEGEVWRPYIASADDLAIWAGCPDAAIRHERRTIKVPFERRIVRAA
jgi:hypothetical protein